MVEIKGDNIQHIGSAFNKHERKDPPRQAGNVGRLQREQNKAMFPGWNRGSPVKAGATSVSQCLGQSLAYNRPLNKHL